MCGSQEWAEHLQTDVLPVVTAGIDLGADMLEIGPGPGAATGWLAERVTRLTALESDEAAAAALAKRFPDVTVAVGDAARMSYPDESFDSVGSFTMLHHVPTTAQQNQILAEVLRVLRPGGRFVFAGEPTSVGNGYARTLSTLTWRITTNVTKLPGLGSWRRPQAELDESSRAAALEVVVDLHTFTPSDLEKMAVSAGAVDVETATVEFTAAMLGWPLRTFEYAVPSERLGWVWAKLAFNSWKTLSWVDENLCRRVVPKGWFYNVMITGIKPS